MPRTIQILPDAVANQIAAGEVVERPASVVKELVENALDAGARSVRIGIEQGGKRSIRVSDDGVGMGREDALLCLDRHATSKIRTAQDLRGIASLGFRGEALPSIASVSRITIETCARGESLGTRIQARGGTIVSVEDFPRAPGTAVTVETLFFNAPARARFLGSPAAEGRAVADAVAPLTLAYPSVAFVLETQDRVVFDLAPASDVLERARALWGDDAVGELLVVPAGSGDPVVRGVVQRPDATRPGFRRSHLFVGGRPFREAALVEAVDRAYRTTIPERNRPWFVLFLEVPPGAVDVNVHPTKAEVRFRDLAGVERAVEDAVRRGLEGVASAASFGGAGPSGRLLVREAPPIQGAGGARGGAGRSDAREGFGAREAPAGQMALFLAGDGAPGVGAETALPEGSTASSPAESESPEGESSVPDGRRPRLWQVHGSWILAEVRGGLLLIDQHAAHERVLFEGIVARMAAGGDASQRLLFPLTIRLAPEEVETVEGIRSLLHATGFEVEGFGRDTVIVHAVPNPHPYFDAETCLREMIAELTRGSDLMRAARNQIERVAMSFACKAAIKAGQELDDREIQELFDRLFATELPYHDVHGRPTTVRLSVGELERKFGR